MASIKFVYRFSLFLTWLVEISFEEIVRYFTIFLLPQIQKIWSQGCGITKFCYLFKDKYMVKSTKQGLLAQKLTFFLFLKEKMCWYSKVLLICTNNIQLNLDSSNTDGSFTMANSNSFLSPYEVLPTAQKNKYLGKFSYFIMKLYVVYTLELPHWGNSNEYTQHTIIV